MPNNIPYGNITWPMDNYNQNIKNMEMPYNNLPNQNMWDMDMSYNNMPNQNKISELEQRITKLEQRVNALESSIPNKQSYDYQTSMNMM